MDLQNKKVAILGWGIDTQDVEPWLKAQGYEVTVLDEKDKPFGDLSSYDMLVRSPGVKLNRPEFAGLNITSKTKIFFDVCPGQIIGVTGTKGKGTTSTLIYEILKAAGKDVYLGGNIGKGVFENLNKMTKDSWVVLELSSFQLIDLKKSPHIGVVLMTTVEHQDWHGSPEEYVQAKSPITKFQMSNDYAVINKDYENSRVIGSQGNGQKVWVSKSDFADPMRLRGEHNRENIAAAIAVAKIIKIQESIINNVIMNFKGLEHRLEEVATVNGVTYFDDSFSTTPETTIAAIKSFSEQLILIVGGSDKGSDFTQMGKVISEAKNIKAVILIGLMADKIESVVTNKKIIMNLKNMSEIVNAAKEIAKPGDVVLLSPACASFDMFKNYKDRGNQFKKVVGSLGRD